ncbi:MAG: hypothetical protein M1825_000550 [Sarcosagium campestre]|nr:MAG: hypothetical protein M1825_000550 [Sarcosagium campestre]
MPICGRRDKPVDVRAEQKWGYINLSDFKSSSCLTPLSYGILYIALLISIFVYVADTYVAVNLLAFDRWSSQVKPPISPVITKWVFAACIILSFLNLAFEWIRAVRVMKRGGIVESYLDPLAVRVQSIRMGKTGRGWRRFLVFTELTKKKKGVEWIALFTHFSLTAWFRVIFAEGPRKVINAITLYAVLRAQLIPEGEHAAPAGQSAFAQFWINFKILAEQDRNQATVLLIMLFTLIIWIFSALNLLIASVMYISFLWHYVPSIDGTLYNYCKRKVDTRLNKIVGVKVQKAFDKEETKRLNMELKALKSGEKLPSIKREPTLPVLGDSKSESFPLTRQPTDPSLPPYSSRPSTGNAIEQPTEREPTIPNLGLSPQENANSRGTSNVPHRNPFADNTPLIQAAGPMGSGNGGRVQPHNPAIPMASSRGRGGMAPRGAYPAGRRGPSPRGPPGYSGPGPRNFDREPPAWQANSRGRGGGGDHRRPPGPNHNFAAREFQGPSYGRLAPAPFQNPASAQIGLARSPSDGRGGGNNDYGGHNPTQRNYTDPSQSRNIPSDTSRLQPPQRSGTAPLPRSGAGYNYSIYDAYGATDVESRAPPIASPARSATAQPSSAWNDPRRPGANREWDAANGSVPF